MLIVKQSMIWLGRGIFALDHGHVAGPSLKVLDALDAVLGCGACDRHCHDISKRRDWRCPLLEEITLEEGCMPGHWNIPAQDT